MGNFQTILGEVGEVNVMIADQTLLTFTIIEVKVTSQKSAPKGAPSKAYFQKSSR